MSLQWWDCESAVQAASYSQSSYSQGASAEVAAQTAVHTLQVFSNWKKKVTLFGEVQPIHGERCTGGCSEQPCLPGFERAHGFPAEGRGQKAPQWQES